MAVHVSRSLCQAVDDDMIIKPANLSINRPWFAPDICPIPLSSPPLLAPPFFLLCSYNLSLSTRQLTSSTEAVYSILNPTKLRFLNKPNPQTHQIIVTMMDLKPLTKVVLIFKKLRATSKSSGTTRNPLHDYLLEREEVKHDTDSSYVDVDVDVCTCCPCPDCASPTTTDRPYIRYGRYNTV